MSTTAEPGPSAPPAGEVLRVCLAQRAAALDPADNLATLDALSATLARVAPPDLVVLPEAFARDFGPPGSDVSADAEDLDGPFATRLHEIARAHDTVVVGGMFERSPDAQRPWNTLVVARPAAPPGGPEAYRKIHLYDSFGYRESDRLSAGDPTPCVVDVAGFRVGLMTCYDLRFPELARSLVDAGAEVIVVPAAWVAGERKVHHWRTLLQARAIENTAYVVAVAQPAPRYSGHSMAVSPLGDVLVEADDADGRTLLAELRRDDLEAARETNPSLANRRL